ncbi:hypothetical protein CDEST_14263 [Colletotrichum destructivum]|uniref:Uncharacterized protein n=1 Tax=Colletotrichum destructivum TaxID=34406 RepID=A0AAX4J118_9PEZI|nr:hypothetical protein CDEST_14263 [Colletotrichum destructivum]
MHLSTIHLLAMSFAGVCSQEFVPCVEGTPNGDSITGFQFVGACSRWAWIAGSDYDIDVSIQSDCSLRQNWPNNQAISLVCIQVSPDPSAPGAVPTKCFWAPDSFTTNTACQLPDSYCNGIVSVLGWPR